MSARERLPDRRGSESFTFELNGLRFTATVSRFADGRVGELFLNNHRRAIRLIPTRATRRSCFRLRSSLALTSERSGAPFAVTAKAVRSVR